MHVYAYIYTYKLVYVYKAYIFVVRIMQLLGVLFFVCVPEADISGDKRRRGMEWWK